MRLRHIPLVRKLRRFARDRRGIAAVEFAMLAPVLTVALLGGTEISRYILMHQKMDRVSTSVSNMVAQSSTMKVVDFDNMWAAAKQVARPFELDAKGRAIISFIVAETDTVYRVSWQRTGAGTLAEVSRIGIEGGLATLPAGITMKQGDTMVAAEVFAIYDAFVFPELVGTPTVYHRSFDRPRLIDTITVE